MSQQELLKRVVQALDTVEIDYMVTGSIASSLQGEPRSTHDIDLVVRLPQEDVPSLLKVLGQPGFYLDPESVIQAVKSGKMFNLIDWNSGDKVDFWILTDDPFDRSRFGRRYPENALGTHLLVSQPEDTILAKLRWAKLSGGSEKQVTDALRVYELQREKLDESYLDEWAQNLDVEDLLAKIREDAESI